jgi:ABC-type polysaccharide transport system permease subunit
MCFGTGRRVTSHHKMIEVIIEEIDPVIRVQMLIQVTSILTVGLELTPYKVSRKMQLEGTEVFTSNLSIRDPKEVSIDSSTCLILHFFCNVRGIVGPHSII